MALEFQPPQPRSLLRVNSRVIAAPDGSSVIRAQMTGAAGDGDALGRRLAQTLLQEGGAVLLDPSQSSLLIATKNGGS
jgi:porphobilinogen deaminase